MSTMACETLSWLKARHMVTRTDNEILRSHSNDILDCFGGIEVCLDILLQNKNNINTLQAIKITDVLTEINKKDKTNNNVNEKNMMKEEDGDEEDEIIIQFDVKNLGTECIEYITKFLSISEISRSFTNVCRIFGIIGIEQIRKTDCYYMNGHDLMIKDKNQFNKHRYVNKTEFNKMSFLNQHRIFKDETFETLFKKLSMITNIPWQYLSIWNYTKRKNGTYRPNRKIALKLNENEEKQPNKLNVTEEMKLTHTIPTNPRKKWIKSIDERIGNLVREKAQFMLLDERKIMAVPNDDLITDSYRILIAIKYFDLFTQTLYFVDWIYVIRNVTKIEDISNYMENDSICKDQYYFIKCKQILKKIEKYESNKEKEDHFMFYEEVHPGRIGSVQCDTLMDHEMYFGDILVFQLNPNHTYFDNHPIIVQATLTQSQQCIYKNADSFIKSMSGDELAFVH